MAENDNINVNITLPGLTAEDINGIVVAGKDGTYNITYTNLTEGQIQQIGNAFAAAMQTNLKNVALHGEYNDLDVKPGIPTGYTQASNFNKIAFSGKASDLDNTDDNDEQVFLTEETDPIFIASPAAGITDTNITNWNNKSEFSGYYEDLQEKPSSFSTNDIIVYDFSNAINDTLKYFNTGYFDTTTQFINNDTATIENKLNLIIDNVFNSNFKKIIKIITSQGPFILNNLFNYNNIYTFSFITTNLTNYTVIDQTGMTQQDILDNLHIIFMTCVLVWDTSTHIGYLINNTSRSE